MLHANRTPLAAQSAGPAPFARHQLGLDEPDGVPPFDPFSSVLSPLPSFLTQPPLQMPQPAPSYSHPATAQRLYQQQQQQQLGLDLSDGGAAFARLQPPLADGCMQPPLFGTSLSSRNRIITINH